MDRHPTIRGISYEPPIHGPSQSLNLSDGDCDRLIADVLVAIASTKSHGVAIVRAAMTKPSTAA